MSFAYARKLAKISQAKVAEQLGVNQSTVCLWDTGKTRPRAALLPQIAELYGCSIDDLLAPDHPEQPTSNT